METDGRPMRRRQRRAGGGCDGPGPGRGTGQGRGQGGGRLSGGARDGRGGLGGRTATRALVAVGAYVAQDLRDAEGVTRPLLRRAALRLAVSRSQPARRLGGAYLRLDPPAPDELPARQDVIDVTPSSPATRALPSPPSGEDGASGGERPL